MHIVLLSFTILVSFPHFFLANELTTESHNDSPKFFHITFKDQEAGFYYESQLACVKDFVDTHKGFKNRLSLPSNKLELYSIEKKYFDILTNEDINLKNDFIALPLKDKCKFFKQLDKLFPDDKQVLNYFFSYAIADKTFFDATNNNIDQAPMPLFELYPTYQFITKKKDPTIEQYNGITDINFMQKYAANNASFQIIADSQEDETIEVVFNKTQYNFTVAKIRQWNEYDGGYTLPKHMFAFHNDNQFFVYYSPSKQPGEYDLIIHDLLQEKEILTVRGVCIHYGALEAYYDDLISLHNHDCYNYSREQFHWLPYKISLDNRCILVPTDSPDNMTLEIHTLNDNPEPNFNFRGFLRGSALSYAEIFDYRSSYTLSYNKEEEGVISFGEPWMKKCYQYKAQTAHFDPPSTSIPIPPHSREKVKT